LYDNIEILINLYIIVFKYALISSFNRNLIPYILLNINVLINYYTI